MAKVLVLGNFELSFELGEGANESSIRAKERRILRFLKKLAEEEHGTVESLELEGFTYAGAEQAEPSGYYYNKYTREEEPKPGTT